MALDETRRQRTAPATNYDVAIGHDLEDLRVLMNHDIATLSPLLRELTGPIVVEQVHEPGKKKPICIAKFTVNAVPILAKLAASRNCPTTDTWEYLKTLELDHARDDRGSPRAPSSIPDSDAASSSLSEKGASIETIVHVTGSSWVTVKPRWISRRLENSPSQCLPEKRLANESARRSTFLSKMRSHDSETASHGRFPRLLRT